MDERPSIQALERASGYVETDNSKIVRGLKSTYKRHGTRNLFAALEVAIGQIKTSKTTLKRREEFLQFIEELSKAIDAFVAAYNPAAQPFKWRKREIKGSQLRNTIVHLSN